MTFVDTSGILAFLDRDSAEHERVLPALGEVLAARRGLTHNYVVVETVALAHRRLGAAVVRRLLADVVPLLSVVWVNGELHAAASAAYLRGLRRRSSLVDHVSFELMRRREMTMALSLDRDFVREGFEVLPA